MSTFKSVILTAAGTLALLGASAGFAGETAEEMCLEDLKKQARDPSSVSISDFRQHQPEKYEEMYIFTYRARNGFGGMNVKMGLCNITDGEALAMGI